MKTRTDAEPTKGERSKEVFGRKKTYATPQLSSFGTLASVTGSAMAGSLFDTMTLMNDGEPMMVMM